ncbi:uncharacterized protein [Triticum aestivum]|uniref:uncharacterized protein n=1 Tax=Triticum aestivum TaxID=4565 RepID=UPI001D00AFC9|nr:uncharacterized protein LOC123172822 [Triticum aestivum]XP_044445662.1 uncharacterized protein LOC123172822 [Triticum aestivum]
MWAKLARTRQRAAAAPVELWRLVLDGREIDWWRRRRKRPCSSALARQVFIPYSSTTTGTTWVLAEIVQDDDKGFDSYTNLIKLLAQWVTTCYLVVLLLNIFM